MADTIFGPTAFSSFSEGVKQGVDMTQYAPQERARTSILSGQAEAQQMLMAEKKAAQALSLQKKAILGETIQENPELNMSKLSDQIKARETAMNSPLAKKDVALWQTLSEDTQALRKQQVETAVELQKQREAQASVANLAINQFLTNPSDLSLLDVPAEEVGLSSQNNLRMLKTMFAPDTKVAVPASLYSAGGTVTPEQQKRTFWQLTPEEQERVKFGIREGNEKLSSAQKDALALSKLQFGYAQLAEQARKNDLVDRQEAQKTAAKREKTDVDKQDDTAKLTIEVNKEIQAHRKNVRTLEMEQAKMREEYGIEKDITEKDDSWFFKDDRMPPAARDKYKLLEDQITDEKTGISEQEARLESAGAKPVPKKDKVVPYSKDSPAKPTSQKDFGALPSGAWFVNPADGKLLQKK